MKTYTNEYPSIQQLNLGVYELTEKQAMRLVKPAFAEWRQLAIDDKTNMPTGRMCAGFWIILASKCAETNAQGDSVSMPRNAVVRAVSRMMIPTLARRCGKREKGSGGQKPITVRTVHCLLHMAAQQLMYEIIPYMLCVHSRRPVRHGADLLLFIHTVMNSRAREPLAQLMSAVYWRFLSQRRRRGRIAWASLLATKPMVQPELPVQEPELPVQAVAAKASAQRRTRCACTAELMQPTEELQAVSSAVVADLTRRMTVLEDVVEKKFAAAKGAFKLLIDQVRSLQRSDDDVDLVNRTLTQGSVDQVVELLRGNCVSEQDIVMLISRLGTDELLHVIESCPKCFATEREREAMTCVLLGRRNGVAIRRAYELLNTPAPEWVINALVAMATAQ